MVAHSGNLALNQRILQKADMVGNALLNFAGATTKTSSMVDDLIKSPPGHISPTDQMFPEEWALLEVQISIRPDKKHEN